MADFTPTEIVDMIWILGECRGNYREASRLYRIRYPQRRHPDHRTIHRLEERARQGHLRRSRARHEYDDRGARVLVVLGLVHLNPHISSRQIERETGIPQRTVIRILRSNRYHPYHITLTQALNANDMRNRVTFCRWALQMILQDPNFFNYVLFSDEATFHSTGQLNRHNSHYWSDQNPHWYRPVDNQHRWSVNVWCGIVNGHLIGPFFFEENVNGNAILELLRDHLPLLLEDVDLETRRRMWIQLDGAGPHFALIVREFLNRNFQQRWIGRGGPVAWPARSPDLTYPDFFLWGYLKNTVFAEAPTTRENMIERIRVACRQISRDILLRTIESFKQRLRQCIDVNNNNFEQNR